MYQLLGHVLDGRVDQRDLELLGRRELVLGGREPPGQHLRRLRTAAGEPADQLVPGRRGQEHQPGTGRGPLDLPRSGHVDLQQAGHARLKLFLQRRARRAIPVASEPRPLQECPAGDETVELAVVDKVIFAAVYFPGPRPTCRNRHGNPDARANPAEFGDDRALPDPGGPGEHGQSRMHRGRDRGFAWIWLRPVAPFSQRTRAQARPAGWFRARVRDAIPLCPAFP